MDKVSGVICFPLCAGKEDPLPPLHNPHPFFFCLCLDVWQWEEWKEIGVRTPLHRVHALELLKGI
jgi:hypothetical protein